MRLLDRNAPYSLTRFREAIGEGAIVYLKSFGGRSVEGMMARSPVLLRIQEGISHQWESDRPSKFPKESVKGDRLC